MKLLTQDELEEMSHSELVALLATRDVHMDQVMELEHELQMREFTSKCDAICKVCVGKYYDLGCGNFVHVVEQAPNQDEISNKFFVTERVGLYYSNGDLSQATQSIGYRITADNIDNGVEITAEQFEACKYQTIEFIKSINNQ